MTAPHPALLELVTGGTVTRVEDEGSFLASALEHRMAATALSAYQDGRLGASPSTVTTLGVWNLAERRQHLRFWSTIRDVQTRLATVGAEIAVMKGVATEARWYDALGERVCTDVDVLLAPAALDRGAEVIHLLDPDRGSAEPIDWLIRRRLLQHVDLRTNDVAVDLHFDPLKIGVPTRQLEEVWASTDMIETPHGKIRVLRPEVELVMLLLHLNKDLFSYLGPFLDVRHIVERASLDWEYLKEFVAAEGLAVPVWKSFAAVADLLGLENPAPCVTGLPAWSWDRLWVSRRG